MKSHRSDCALLLALIAAATTPVLAAPAEPEAPAEEARVAQAREAFRLGSALARQAQWPEALGAFERSAKLHPHATTTFNIGYCERALGRFTRARKVLALALAESARATAPELSAETRVLAEGYLAEMNKRVAHARVTVRGPGVRLTVDGAPLEAASERGQRVLVAGTRDPGSGEPVEQGDFDLLADPGTRVIVVTQQGQNRILRQHFVPGSPIAFTVGSAPRTHEASATRRVDHTWAVVAFGVGAAGVAVGVTSGLTALREKSALDDACTRGIDRCDPRYQGDIDSMNRAATVSTVAFGVGALGIGTGVYCLLSGSAEQPKARARIGPRSVAFERLF